MRFIKINIFIILFLFSSSKILAQKPWQIKNWVYKEGSYEGQKLGSYVHSPKKNNNLQYLGLISDVKQIGGYTFTSINDTSINKIFPGSNFLIGDLNNDNYLDLVVNKKNKEDWPIVSIYWGNSTGIDTNNAFVITAKGMYDLFEAKTIGDINNDGKQDLILTEPSYPNGFSTGRVYIYLNPIISIIQDYYIEGEEVRAALGQNAVIGDINGDNLNDLIVNGWNQQVSVPDSLRFSYLNIYYAEKNNYVNTTSNQQIRHKIVNGSSALAAIDVNGDKIKDVLWITSNKAEPISIHFGKVNKVDSIPNLKLKTPRYTHLIEGLYNAGDMNGDGYDDIVAGIPKQSYDFGFIMVWSGGPKMDEYFDAGVGLDYDAKYGASVTPLGDVNGDGCADLLVGAPIYKWYHHYGCWFIELGSKNIPVTSVRDEKIQQPVNFKLLQNYPNPFNPITTISYIIDIDSYVTLTIYNTIGEKIKDLLSAEQNSGMHNINFDASKYSSGVYYYKLTAIEKSGKTQSESKAMTIIK